MIARIAWLSVSAIVLALLFCPGLARANGGTVEVADRPVGPYLVAVMSSPSPLEVGVADVSVLVYLPTTKKSVEDATVEILATPAGTPGAGSSFPATHANATNKFFYAANVEFPSAGPYNLTVHVAGPSGGGEVSFAVQVAQAPLAVSPVEVSAAAIPVFGFVVWYFLRRRSAPRSVSSDEDRQDPLAGHGDERGRPSDLEHGATRRHS